MAGNRHPEKLRLLGIFAHPHDFTHAAGTLGNHVRDDDSATVVILTDGGGTHNEKLRDELLKPADGRNEEILEASREEYVKQKIDELKKAAGYFGIADVRVFPYPDRPLKRTDEVVARVVELLCEVRPDILITECPAHIAGSRAVPVPNDHYTVAAIVGEALTVAGFAQIGSNRVPHRPAQLYYLATDLPYGEIDFYVDITEQYDNRLKAEMCFASQSQTSDYGRKRIETLPGYFGFFVGVGYAETFVRGGLKVDRRLSVTPRELALSREASRDRIARQELKA